MFDKPQTCRYCGKIYTIARLFRKHIRQHELPKSFGCLLCSYKAKTMYQIKIHTMTHSNDQPFVCNYCGKKYRQKSVLKRHQNLNHTPGYQPKNLVEKKYKCSKCCKTYVRAGDRDRHVKVHAQDGIQAVNFKRQAPTSTITTRPRTIVYTASASNMEEQLSDMEEISLEHMLEVVHNEDGGVELRIIASERDGKPEEVTHTYSTNGDT